MILLILVGWNVPDLSSSWDSTSNIGLNNIENPYTISVFYVPLLFFIQSSCQTCVYTIFFLQGWWNHQLVHPCNLRFFAVFLQFFKSRGLSRGRGFTPMVVPSLVFAWLALTPVAETGSLGDLFWMVKTWPFQRLSYLQLVDEKVTVLNHHLFQQHPNFKTNNLIWNWGIQDTHGQINAHIQRDQIDF